MTFIYRHDKCFTIGIYMTNPLTPLLTRRSTSVKDMRAPAPSDAELEQILTIATRVPDHGKLCPWRLVVLRGEGARALGAIAAAQFAAQNTDATEAQIAAEHARFTRAPLCIAVLSTPVLGTKPVWEQELSARCRMHEYPACRPMRWAMAANGSPNGWRMMPPSLLLY
jgi:nitroreductase